MRALESDPWRAVRVADEVTKHTLLVLDRPAALVQILEEMRRMPWPACKVGLVRLHLQAHGDRLVGGVVVGSRQRRPLTPRHKRLRLAVLVPFVLELARHVARLGGGEDQAILVVHQI